MMKRIFILFLPLLLCILASGQTRGSELLETLHSKRVTMDYLFSNGKVIVGRGEVIVNGNWYLTRSKGLDVYCDGKTRWLVDTFAKEVYIEEAGGTGDFIESMDRYLSNVRNLKLSSDHASGDYLDPSTGEKVRFEFSGMKKTELGDDVSEFRFSPEGLDSSWVVTDLR